MIWKHSRHHAFPWMELCTCSTLSVTTTLHLSCTTGQVIVASSALREISFTHTMTRGPSSPNLPSLEELRLYLQCTNSSSCPWHPSIETCAFQSVVSIMRFLKKRGQVQHFRTVTGAGKLSTVALLHLKQWQQKLLMIPPSIQSLDGRSLRGTDRNGLHILPSNVNEQ